MLNDKLNVLLANYAAAHKISQLPLVRQCPSFITVLTLTDEFTEQCMTSFDESRCSF